MLFEKHFETHWGIPQFASNNHIICVISCHEIMQIEVQLILEKEEKSKLV